MYNKFNRIEKSVAHTYTYRELHVEELRRKHLSCVEARSDQLLSITLPIGVLALVNVTKCAFGKGVLEAHAA